MHDTDPLFEALRKLPPRKLGEREVRAGLARAIGVLADPARPRVPFLSRVSFVWSRVVAPAIVTATVATYLVWAVTSAEALYR